ncbi:MAG: hypothetical protein ACP5O4_03855 [bacterium]
MDKNYLFKNLIISLKNIFDTINIKYSPNDSIKINENLNNLLDSLEKIRKKYLYDELLQTMLIFLIIIIVILIIYSVIYIISKSSE